MDTGSVRDWVGILGTIGVVVVWLIRLEGKVNTNKALHDELKDDVRYIRDRIDRALNGRGA